MFEPFLLSLLLATPPQVDALLKSADAARMAYLGKIINVRVTLSEPQQADRMGEFDLYLGSEDKQLVVFKDEKNVGRKFLTVGDKAWLLVAGAKNPIPISSNQRMLGSAGFADVARVRLSRDYRGQLRLASEACGELENPCRVVDVHANNRSAAYASGTLWIDAQGLLQRASFNLASGKPAKAVQYFYTYKDGNAWLTKTVIDDLLLPQKSLTTTLEYRNARDASFAENFFDPKRALRH